MYDNRKAFGKLVGGNGRSLAPFGWVGGKSQLSPFLLTYIPEHQKYVEVFGGGLNLLWSKKRSKLEVVNDFDGELVNLYRVIKLHPQALTDALATMWHSRELFYVYRDAQIERPAKNNIERAARTYYVISTSYAAKRQHFGRSISVGKLSGARLYRDFRVWSERLKLVQIENRDFQKLIEEYDSPDAFFYVDPPYFGCEDYYAKGEGFGKADHERLAETLKDVKGRWLLSYSDTPEIRGLYEDFEIVETPEITYSLAVGKAKKIREIIIKNY